MCHSLEHMENLAEDLLSGDKMFHQHPSVTEHTWREAQKLVLSPQPLPTSTNPRAAPSNSMGTWATATFNNC